MAPSEVKVSSTRSFCGRGVCLVSLVALLMAGLLVTASRPAFAAEPEYRWAIGPWGGAYKFIGGEGDRSTVGPEAGVELEHLFNSRLGIGLRAGYGQNGEWEEEDYLTKVLSGEIFAKAMFNAGWPVIPYACLGFGAYYFRAEIDGRDAVDVRGKTVEGTDMALKIGLGIRADVSRTVTFDLRATGAPLFREDEDMELGGLYDPNDKEIEVTASLLMRFNPLERPVGDSDRDGVKDDVDRCPDTPSCTRVDRQGCPTGAGFADADRDGVADRMDRCPDTPLGATVDQKGCPMDTDGDGVYDGIDECPNTPLGTQVNSKGCPRDTDGDGVYDGKDECPGTPRGVTVDSRGCPVDSDGDGVPDGIDQCPDTPRGSTVDAKGCVPPPPAKPSKLTLEGVNFEFNKSNLLLGARATLDEVARDLLQYRQIRVEVQGHTDSKGELAYNMKLSNERANAVRDYLISQGVAADRLVAKGYGETVPIASNETDEGRARNRRVEFVVIE